MVDNYNLGEDDEGGLPTGVGRLLQMRRRLLGNSSVQSKKLLTQPEPMPTPAESKERAAGVQESSSVPKETMTENEAMARVAALAERLRDKKATPPPES